MIRSGTRSGGAMIRRFFSGEASWSLLDQGAVSGGNFLTTLVLARTLAPAQYGSFSLLLLALYAINTCHGSLIVYPLTLQGAKLRSDQLGSLAGAAVVHTLMLAAPLALIGIAVAFVLHHGEVWPMFAAAMVAWQLQETARRTQLAALEAKAALLPDLLCYAGQAAVLALLRTKDLRVIFLVITVTSLAAAAWQLYLVRVKFTGALGAHHREYGWKMGRFVLAGNVLNMATLQVPSWTLAVVASRVAVAGYQSLMNLVGVANPVIFSVSNLLIPAIAKSSLTGVREARRTMLHYGARFGLLLLPAFLLLAVAPHPVMRWVYGIHSPYLTLAGLLPWLVLAFALQYLATVVGAYEGGMSRPKTYMWVQVAGTGVLLLICALAIPRIGIPGAIAAMVLASAARLAVFIILSRSADREILNLVVDQTLEAPR